MPRVFVTGATGFVGRAVTHALRAEGYAVRCLVRRGSERHLQGLGAVERVEGDILVPEGLADEMGGCEAAIHLVGIIREPSAYATFENVHVQGTRNVLAAAAAAGVRRFLHMSALGARPAARSRYHKTKWAAEEAVRGSGLNWTIFRPSIIYGRGDEFVSMLAGMVRFPVVPVIGNGRQRLQPVPVEHVAEGFARALALPATEKQAFEVCGPDAVTMLELLDLVGRAQGRSGRVRKFHMPIGLMRPLARVLHRMPGFPLTPDQLLMLEEENVGDPKPFYSSFGLTPLPLAAGLRRILG